MNKVFSCADDCHIQIHHQDTDSLHLNDDDDVDKIVKRCKQQRGQ